MSWFSFTDIAKTALSEAQKKIDKALDIQGAGINQPKSTDIHAQLAEHETDSSLQLLSQYTDNNSTNHQVKEAKLPSKKKSSRPDSSKNFSTSQTTSKCSKSDVSSDDFFSAFDNELKNSKSKVVIEPKTTISRSSSYTEVTLSAVSESYDISEITETHSVSGRSSAHEKNTLECEKDVIKDSENNDTTDQITDKSNQEVDECENSESFELSKPPNIISLGLKEEFIADVPESPSTAASSEIDILDHESPISEISLTSKFAEGQNLVQSPLSLPITDANDSDVCQIVSPISDANRLITDNSFQQEEEISSERTSLDIPSHSFQPVKDAELVDYTRGSSCDESTDLTNQRSTEPEVLSDNEGDSFISNAMEETTYKEKHDTPPKVKDANQYNGVVLSEKLEVYEQQLFNLSCKNAQLCEENDNLRSEVSRTKEQCEKEASKEVAEVTVSVGNYKKANELLKEEHSNLMKQISVLKSQLAARMTNEQVQSAMAEKEESIKGLLEEGEKLSKKHLQQNNLIKKQKSQLQERDSELKAAKEKITTLEIENLKMKQDLQVAHGVGKEEREASMRITDAYEQREREWVLLQEKLSQAEEKERTLQVNLDAAYVEIRDLRKQNAEQEGKASSERVVLEEELDRVKLLELKKLASEHEHQKQLIMLQILELNNSVSRTEAMAARKDDEHRKELRDIQQRLQESEVRNQDLSESISSATRPLLRQIANLQASHSTQQRSWNALEKTLTTRLNESQSDLLTAQENARMAQSTMIEAKSKTGAYEKQIESNRKMIAEQMTDIESLNKTLGEYKTKNAMLNKELSNLRKAHQELLSKAKKEKLTLENQLQMEKVRSEADRKKYTTHQESLQREKERQAWLSRSDINSTSSNLIVETESVASSSEAFQSIDVFEKKMSTSSLTGLANSSSSDGTLSLSLSNVLENLQTQLKLKEGEIAQLKGEINMLERTRSSMAEEIVRLTNLTEDMESVSEELKGVEENLQGVEGRYTELLTMYGEMEETNEELRMDLADVKAMYRQQINDLLKADPS